MPKPAFSRDSCPVCGAPALVDAGAEDDHYPYSISADSDDDWEATDSMFLYLTCRACRASLDLCGVSRRWQRATNKIEYIADPYGKKRRVHSIRGVEIEICEPQTFEIDVDALPRWVELEKRMWRAKRLTSTTLASLKSGDWPPHKLTPWLHAAIYYGKVALISPLIALGASTQQALPWALANRQVDAALALLEHDVDPNEPLDNGWLGEHGIALRPHLQVEFAGLGQVVLRHLLNLAVLYGAPRLVERLLEKGATLEADNQYPTDGDEHEIIRLTPWTLAVLTGQRDLVEQLWGSGPSDPSHALYYALCAGREEIARRLLAEGVDLWQTSTWVQAETNLHAAARGGMDWAVELWSQRQPNIRHIRAKNGITPLHVAARCLHSTTARILLQHGADPNARGNQARYNQRKFTPLHEAINVLHRGGTKDPSTVQAVLEMVSILLDGGADPNLRYNYTFRVKHGYPEPWQERPGTPLLSASILQLRDLYDLLIEHGADVNRTIQDTGHRPLIEARC